MRRKQIFLIFLIVVTLIIAIVLLKTKKVKIKEMSEPPSISINKSYDEETGLYYLKDEETGEIIFASQDENDPSFEFYIEHPDYNPNPLNSSSKSLEDFIYYGEYVENY